MDDCVIVGAGVIGLSLAYELAGHGLRVRIIDRQQPGTEASWAGAGIFPPGTRAAYTDPYEELFAFSTDLHRRWAAQLKEETGIDNGYRRCGAIYFAREHAIEHGLRDTVAEWRRQKVAVEELSPARFAEIEPALAALAKSGTPRLAVLVPDEVQIRNPRHLQALVAGCIRRGVTVTPEAEVLGFDIQGSRVEAVRTAGGRFAGGCVCVSTGSWTSAVLDLLGVQVPIKPIRGQIVLLQGRQASLSHIIYEGPHYLVPRDDGRVLVGSTLEDVGFDKRNTTEAVDDLLRFAGDVAPVLREAQVERSWAGLRPSTVDGLPYLGRVPKLSNAFVAAGHFRSGLQLSPGTAVVLSRLIRGEPPQLDLTPFNLDRS